MKHFLCLLIFIMMIFSFYGCVTTYKNQDILEGYWMDNKGATISFLGNGNVVWYGENYTYTIYDENKVLVMNNNAEKGNYKFEKKDNILTLTDLYIDYDVVLYGDEKAQKEILKDIEEQEERHLEEEGEWINEMLQYEYDTALTNLIAYKENCELLMHKAATNDKDYYTSEIEKINKKIQAFKKNDEQEIRKHLYEEACNLIWENIISKDNIDYNKLIFDDEDMQLVTVTESKKGIIAYLIHIRVNTNSEVTYTYGSYAVHCSSKNIFEYDVATNTWNQLKYE